MYGQRAITCNRRKAPSIKANRSDEEDKSDHAGGRMLTRTSGEGSRLAEFVATVWQ